jgi:hypothetical protein
VFEAISSVLGNMPGGDVLGMILKILGIVLGAVMGVLLGLWKLGQFPLKLALEGRTVVRTRGGKLEQHKALLYTRKSWKKYWRRSARKELNKGAPLKKHSVKRVYYIPWYMTVEEFDHRKNPQSLSTITFEKSGGQQWEAPLMISSEMGSADSDMQKVWRAVQDRDENLRMLTGSGVTDALLDCDSAEYAKRGISERITADTFNVRLVIYLLTGINVKEVWFPSGIRRTPVDAMRHLGSGTGSVVAAQQSSNGHASAI